MLCEECCDIKDYLCTLLSAVQQLHNAGLNTVTKTLLVGVLMKSTSPYICKCLESIDNELVQILQYQAFHGAKYYMLLFISAY